MHEIIRIMEFDNVTWWYHYCIVEFCAYVHGTWDFSSSDLLIYHMIKVLFYWQVQQRSNMSWPTVILYGSWVYIASTCRRSYLSPITAEWHSTVSILAVEKTQYKFISCHCVILFSSMYRCCTLHGVNIERQIISTMTILYLKYIAIYCLSCIIT